MKRRTLFMAENNPHAILVINSGKRQRQENYWFTSPQYGLSWCERNGCNFVYNVQPSAPSSSPALN